MQGGTAVAHRRKVAASSKGATDGGGAGGSSTTAAAASPSSSSVPVATVKRRKWGTSPFDEHWLNVDCCGLICAFLTYCLHAYGCYTVCVVLIPPWLSYMAADNIRKLTPWGWFHSIMFCVVAFLACLSHFYAMTTDPGAVPPDAKPLPELLEEGVVGEGGEALGDGSGGETGGLMGDSSSTPKTSPTPAKKRRHVRLCRRCNAFKPQRAHHCSVCKRCIIKMDHHCPWVNNCVGIGNHKYFLLFILYTSLSCGYSMLLMICRAVACTSNPRWRSRNVHCLDEPTHLINILFLVVEALLFGLFTCCMKVDQWDVVMSNVTHIDRLKGQDSSIKKRVAGTLEVFGVKKSNAAAAAGTARLRDSTKFRPDWLSPFAQVCFPSGVRDDIFGYCRPCLNHVVSHQNSTVESDVELTPLNPNGNNSNTGGRMVKSVTEIV